MRHKHERSGKFHQAVFQHIERWNIQIVRRLVQDQEIGRLEHQACDEESGLFPSGQAGDGKIQLLRSEEKPLRP